MKRLFPNIEGYPQPFSLDIGLFFTIFFVVFHVDKVSPNCVSTASDCMSISAAAKLCRCWNGKKVLSFSVGYGYLVKSLRQEDLRSLVVVFWLASSINFFMEMVRSTSTQTASAFLADNLCNRVMTADIIRGA